MNRSQVALLLVVVTLVVLSVVGLVSHGTLTPDVDCWRTRLFAATNAAPESTCAGSFTGTCVVKVAKSDTFMRKLELVTRDKVKVEFASARLKDPVQVDLDTSFDEKLVSLLVDSAGAALTLRCVGPLPAKTPATCSVVLR
jgi:hypothetical protein